MALVDYSGSEDSENDEIVTIPAPANTRPNPNKPAFQKVVDPTNPHKIRINLPDISKNVAGKADNELEPPLKRAKVGSGGLSGFNSFLPAPKQPAPNVASGRVGLSRGVSLKTGAAPGFTREAAPIIETYEDAEYEKDEGVTRALKVDTDNDQKDKDIQKDQPLQGSNEQPKKKAPMFKPLSVARKPPKRRPPPSNGLSGTTDQVGGNTEPPKAIPKTSLFSIEDTRDTPSKTIGTKGAYQPMVYQPENLEPRNAAQSPTSTFDVEEQNPPEIHALPTNPTMLHQTPQSLDSIASDLNLSASAKRQLLGRQKTNSSSINVVNFNTDQEYAANETLRQAGEQALHNPVRAIAPGKHSLKQLVNAATIQKDALEESFASGRRNRQEAGSKYGW